MKKVTQKQSSNKYEFECTICGFKTNDKKENSDHISFAVHIEAAMKKIMDNLI